MNYELSERQSIAWHYLEHDPVVTELLYGGAAGGGKSLLGCIWHIHRRATYPGSRGLIGRSKLKALKESTLITFFAVCAKMGYKSDIDYKYNAQDHSVKWKNGSHTSLKDLFQYPSDPDFTSLGSTEYTDAFIDEGTEITQKAFDIVQSRIRYKLKEFDLVPKILITGNPQPGWVKNRFVQDEHSNPIKLKEYQKFVPSTVADNPDPDFVKSYKAQLLKMSDNYDISRLLYGDWSALPNVERPFAFAFQDSHISNRAVHRPGMITIVSIDFNVQPFCGVFKHIWQDNEGWHNHTWAEVSVDNGSIEEMANRIRSMVDVRSIEITGDAMGNNRRVKIKESDNANLFISLRQELKLHPSQIRVKPNPYHKQSRENFNFMLQNCDYAIHPSCVGTIRDLRTVEIDTDGKIIKSNRAKESERADYIDGERYAENVYFEKFRKLHGRK